MLPRRKFPSAADDTYRTDLLADRLAIRKLWRILNAEARGKITTGSALGAMLHVCMKGLDGRASE